MAEADWKMDGAWKLLGPWGRNSGSNDIRETFHSILSRRTRMRINTGSLHSRSGREYTVSTSSEARTTSQYNISSQLSNDSGMTRAVCVST